MVLADSNSVLVAHVLAAVCLIYIFFSEPFVWFLPFGKETKQNKAQNLYTLGIMRGEKITKEKNHVIATFSDNHY